MQATAEQDGFPQLPQSAEGEFQADTEKQKDDADLGHDLDLAGFADQPQSIWPDQRTGQDETGNGRKACASEERDNDNGCSKYDNQIFKKVNFRHDLWEIVWAVSSVKRQLCLCHFLRDCPAIWDHG